MTPADDLPPLQEAFEKWSFESGFDTVGQARGQDSYVSFSDAWAWKAWQEADRLARADLTSEIESLRLFKAVVMQEEDDLEKDLRALADALAARAEAAEARVKDFQEALNTAQRCIVEAETERDTLRARVAELEECLRSPSPQR